MKSELTIGEYRFECEDVDAEGMKGIKVYKNGFEQTFYMFGGKGEIAFKIRCYDVHFEMTGKKS